MISFSLADETWLTCILDGLLVDLSLRDALARAHEIDELWGESSLVIAAQYRLLLAILHRVFGPADADAWAEIWRAGRFDSGAVDAYLQQWRDRFDLFHPEFPFYQTTHVPVNERAVNKLIPHVAAGGNPTVADHNTDDRPLHLSPAEAARHLVAVQAFALGGGHSGLGRGRNFTDGPCARGVIFLVRGSTLFQTLCLNLLRYPDDAVFATFAGDVPVWEREAPFARDPLTERPARHLPDGYLDLLTWPSRRVLLEPAQAGSHVLIRRMRLTQGLILADGILDPMKSYQDRSDATSKPLRFSDQHVLWRHSAALLALDSERRAEMPVCRWLSELAGAGYIDAGLPLRLQALGMANYQGKISSFLNEQMALSLAYLSDPESLTGLAVAVRQVDDARRQLWGSLWRLAALYVCPSSDEEGGRQPDKESVKKIMDRTQWEQRFWSNLNLPFSALLATLPYDREGAMGHWKAALRRTARRSFEAAADSLGTGSHTYRARTRASQQLWAGLRKVGLNQIDQ